MVKQSRSEKGQALVLIVFAIIGLLSLLGLAIDSGKTFADRRQAQNAVDAAASAAALAYVKDLDIVAAGTNLILGNGYSNANSTYSINVANDTSCASGTSGKVITVTLTSTVPMSFAPILGVNHTNNTVSAKSRGCKGSASQPLYPGSAIVSLKTGTCNGSATAGLYMNGSGNLQVWGGGMHSNSTDPNCTLFQGGQTQIKKNGSSCNGITTAAPSGTFNNVQFPDSCGNITKNVPPVGMPDLVSYSCGGTPSSPGRPGTYSGTFPPSGVTSLAPGLYCLNGDFDLNNKQKLTGTGVTIVMLSGSARWNGGAEMSISAPSNNNTANDQVAKAAGAIPGLLIYAPPSNNSDIDLNGSGNVTLQGTVLVPSSDCFFAGSGQIQKAKLQFVCNTWRMNGNGQGEIVYDPSVLYIPPSASNITLIR
jgi:hypothetical protein